MTETRDLDGPLYGYLVIETIRRAYLPAVGSFDEGRGHVGRLLAELMADYDEIVVPVVVSAKLAGMLDRRGFHAETRYAPAPFDETIDCWVWRRSSG